MNKNIKKLITMVGLCACISGISQPSISYGLENENKEVEYTEDVKKNGWVIENNEYYYYKDNQKQVGWLKEGKNWFWLDSEGIMASNEWVAINGKWYRFTNFGRMFSEEWYQDSKGDWYWLKSSGAMASNETLNIKGKEYRFNGSGRMLTDKEMKVENIIDLAHKQIGKPYKWGSGGPNSFDCSGLTSYVYKNGAKISIPRTSKEQSTTGLTIKKSDLQKGDLVFFNTSGSGISHVGLYIGDSKMIHSPSSGKNVKVENINSNYYTKTYVTAKRVIK